MPLDDAQIKKFEMNDIEKARRIDKFSAHLKVVEVNREFLKRVGNDGDGGYIMDTNFSRNAILISAGIGNDVSWDFDMLNTYGAKAVIQIDHTIGGKPPREDSRVIFVNKMLEGYDSQESVTLGWLIDRLPREYPKILKIDIEGSEWEVFAATKLSQLRNFDQICVEFHNLHKVIFDEQPQYIETMAKLATNHVPIHVHANNWGAYEIIANRPVPDVVEVTYLSRHLIRDLIPQNDRTHLDAPNHPSRPDIRLSFY
jgi:hypothetical protein